ncbi:MAG: hypothetical protein RL562_1526, partial [Planctomycetota bacterium]
REDRDARSGVQAATSGGRSGPTAASGGRLPALSPPWFTRTWMLRSAPGRSAVDARFGAPGARDARDRSGNLDMRSSPGDPSSERGEVPPAASVAVIAGALCGRQAGNTPRESICRTATDAPSASSLATGIRIAEWMAYVLTRLARRSNSRHFQTGLSMTRPCLG